MKAIAQPKIQESGYELLDEKGNVLGVFADFQLIDVALKNKKEGNTPGLIYPVPHDTAAKEYWNKWRNDVDTRQRDITIRR